MVDEQYVAALVIYAKDSAANYAWLEKRRCDLAALLVTHGGGQLLSVAAPGQHIAYGRPSGTTIQEEFAGHRMGKCAREGRDSAADLPGFSRDAPAERSSNAPLARRG